VLPMPAALWVYFFGLRMPQQAGQWLSPVHLVSVLISY
jgi:hypothetical protein